MKRVKSLFLPIIIHLGLITLVFADADTKCGFQEVHYAFLRGERLVRPEPGPNYIYSTHFIVHYATSGQHQTTRAYAESVSVYAEYSWAKQIDSLGWIEPPPDNNQGGDNRYDIYIRDIPAHGRATPESPYPEPYPNGYTSYIEIDIGLTWNLLRVTVAHEFNHASQLRYNVGAAENRWWYENTATWMEDICYDEINDYVNYLNTNPNPLNSPHLPITTVTNSYEYAGAILPMFLHEYYNIACPRRVWERIGERGAGAIALASIDWVLRNTFRSTLAEAMKNYAVWRYFTGPRADTVYHFLESHLWSESEVLQIHNTYPASGNQGNRAPSGPGGANFIQFRSGTEDLLNVTFDGQDEASWAASLIGYRYPQQSVEREIVLDGHQRGTGEIPWQGNDHIALIAVVTVTLSPSNLTHTYQALQAPHGRWFYTGPLNTGRCGNSTTLLPNGKVLMAGGWNTQTVFSSCELYDPTGGGWSYTGSLRQARDNHRAILLLNGKVLVAAGSHWGDLRSCELYDTITGTWSYTGSLTKARHSPEIVLLNDGKVLIVGGTRAGRTCEIYDPISGTWSITDSIRPVGRGLSDFTLTLLPNGKVLLAGGRIEQTGQIFPDCQIYDPSSGSWSNASPLNQARAWHRAILLNNGKVLVTGGRSVSGDLASCELYDPTTNTWSYTGSLNMARRSHYISFLPDGKILVAGGLNENRTLRSSEIYDWINGVWRYTDSLNVGRSNCDNAVLLRNGKVLIAGGHPNIRSCELYASSSVTFPQIWTIPRYLNLTLQQNQIKDTILRIFNNGDANLEWLLAENPSVDWLSANPTSGTVPPRPNNRMDVAVRFNTTGLAPGIYHTNLVITSNDPDLPEKIVSVELRVRTPVDIIEYSTTKLLPKVFALENNIPNPFISRTIISYALLKESRVNLLVYNSSGILVRTLKAGTENTGHYRIIWNGDDDKGKKVPNGIYFYRLEAGEFTATKKMVKME